MNWNELKMKLLSAAIAPAALGACTTPTPQLDATFGHAVNAAKAQQTINPEASKNTDPVLGLDGKAANESIGRYHDTFRAPPPTFVVITPGAGTQ
jgi:hypothetical protein